MNDLDQTSLTPQEKEEKTKEFLNFTNASNTKNTNTKKDSTKILYLRVPESYWKDIKEIMSLTGLSLNAVCLELLRPVIKKKLREIKNDLL